VRAIGDGLDLAEIRQQLLATKTTVATLETQLAALAVPAPVDLERIKKRGNDWRGILRRGPAMPPDSQQILPGKLQLMPTEGGATFRGPEGWGALFAGTVYEGVVVAPGISKGSPRCRLG
jgi:hypothetical protein